MCRDVPYFIVLICLTPDYFTCQEESAASQWVKFHKINFGTSRFAWQLEILNMNVASYKWIVESLPIYN
jgi:hypothetical protein